MKLFSSLIITLSLINPTLASNPAPDPQLPASMIIAHRGIDWRAPEETVPAYLLARELGADYLEMDIHRTKDCQIVLIHDDDLLRTTDADTNQDILWRAANIGQPAGTQYPVRNYTLRELRTLDIGSKWNTADAAKGETLSGIPAAERARFGYAHPPEFPQNLPDGKKLVFGPAGRLRILTLENIITLAEGGKVHHPGLYIEFKSPTLYYTAKAQPNCAKFGDIEEQTVKILQNHGWLPPKANADFPKKEFEIPAHVIGVPPVQVAATNVRVVFQSFDPRSIMRLNALDIPKTIPKILLADHPYYDQEDRPLTFEAALRLKLGAIRSGKPDPTRYLLTEASARYAGATGIGPIATFLIPGADGRIVPSLIHDAHRDGLFVHPYVLDNPIFIKTWQRLERLETYGLVGIGGSPEDNILPDGFFTDRADLALQLVRKPRGLDLERRAEELLDLWGYEKNAPAVQ